MPLNSNDRSTLIRLAHSLPHGDEKRRAILTGMIQVARGDFPDFADQVDRASKMDGVDPSVAKLITESGLEDGDRGDDVISVGRKQWPASALKPSQTSMVLDKALQMALHMLRSGKVGGDLGAIVSSDGHILDGHHRWAATILASGSKGKVGGYGAALPGKELLKVLNIISKGAFNVRNGKPGKGSLASFTEGNVRDLLTEYATNGVPGKFSIPVETVRGVLESAYGTVENAIDTIASHAKLIPTSVPGWAPDRKQMPVIEPGEVPAASQLMSQGLVDWNDPHRKEGARSLTASDRVTLVRIAASLPKGDVTRRAILSGLQKVVS
jgi:hypothetical protein